MLALPAFMSASAQQPRRLFVNQTGYARHGVKRFTAVGVADKTAFELIDRRSGRRCHLGLLHGGVGDFSSAHLGPGASDGGAYVLRLVDDPAVQSDPFDIGPHLPVSAGLDMVVPFLTDVRSLIGTHPSAYGGRAFRDGTFYSYETASLITLWCAHPDYFLNLPRRIERQSDCDRLLDPNFHWIRDTGDTGALETARRYYRELPPPIGGDVPDAIALIHWGIGFSLLSPVSQDPSDQTTPAAIHAQTVEEFAFFLHALPTLRQWFAPEFTRRVQEVATTLWPKVGLFDVITEVGGLKGRHAPGHSILPNLMMAEAVRAADPAAAQRHTAAARAQAAWIIANVDLTDPRYTKGQRQSENRLATGLCALLLHHPDSAPPGLADFLRRYAAVIEARSENMWDFRRWDETQWGPPRWSAESPQPAVVKPGSGWNDVGNVAGLPGVTAWLARVDSSRAARLRAIGVAHLDTLAGRNPIGAHAANHGVKDYFGVERGWPVHYPPDICARLELVRGTLSSSASNEHYPYNPSGAFRHPEGWVAFNASYNMSLAELITLDGTIGVEDVDGRPIETWPAARPVRLFADIPRGIGTHLIDTVTLRLDGAGETRSFTLAWNGSRFTLAQPVRLDRHLADDGTATLRYGHGYWSNALTVHRRGETIFVDRNAA
ncbi:MULTISPECIES: hypothetical protein [unclassified Sphingomonas]|uniref:hypothetical protein n=1 Tax=unclassified Sphingomonas TaxID=196159 RepID=UPI0012E3938E|nr:MULTISPECIES: hypothetical protein [unclassified Sphingomonas]